MRIIATQFYFPENEIRGRAWRADARLRDIGFSVLWFRANTNRPIDPRDFSTFEWDSYRLTPVAAVIHRFIDLSLRGRRGRIDRYGYSKIQNQSLADEIIHAEIVLQRSPHEGISLLELLKNASYVAVGSYVGLEFAGDRSWLMWLSVPGGVIMMGAASGIAKGLANGLSRSIEKFIAERD